MFKHIYIYTVVPMHMYTHKISYSQGTERGALRSMVCRSNININIKRKTATLPSRNIKKQNEGRNEKNS